MSYENIIDLLSIVTGKPLTAPLQYIQALGQGHDTMITKQSVAGMRRRARHLLSDHEVETFREFIRGWEACSQRHDAVELVSRAWLTRFLGPADLNWRTESSTQQLRLKYFMNWEVRS